MIAALKLYWVQFRIYAFIAAFVGWTWVVYDLTKTYTLSSIAQEKVVQQEQVIEAKDESVKVSVEAGRKYEPKRAAIQTKLATPDRNLDARIQTNSGDVVMPAELGMRLNELAQAAETSGSSGELDATMRSIRALPDDGHFTTGLETDTGSKYSISGRLPRAP